MVEFLSTYWSVLAFSALNAVWIFAILWGVERLFPRGRAPGSRDLLIAAKFLVLSLVVSSAVATIFGLAAQGTEPLLEARLPPIGWPLYVLGPLAYFYFYDFFNYWMHRAQHRWFWRQHAVHHAIEDISAVNSYFHWSEEVFRTVFIAAPMTFVVGLDARGVSLLSTMITFAYGNFIHSPTSINLGPLSRFLVDNRWHRIHHSAEPRHWNHNFGTAVTLWDHLFGTAYVPRPAEWPRCGVPDAPQISTVRQYLAIGHPALLGDRETAEGAVSVLATGDKNAHANFID